jgi:hypothetical protein
MPISYGIRTDEGMYSLFMEWTREGKEWRLYEIATRAGPFLVHLLCQPDSGLSRMVNRWSAGEREFPAPGEIGERAIVLDSQPMPDGFFDGRYLVYSDARDPNTATHRRKTAPIIKAVKSGRL